MWGRYAYVSAGRTPRFYVSRDAHATLLSCVSEAIPRDIGGVYCATCIDLPHVDLGRLRQMHTSLRLSIPPAVHLRGFQRLPPRMELLLNSTYTPTTSLYGFN